MVDRVEEVKLLAIRDGAYTVYVFQNAETKALIMCTRPPNWQTDDVSVGEEGFLKYQVVKAGEEYYDPTTDTSIKYRYTNTYFINFVRKSEISKENNIIL